MSRVGAYVLAIVLAACSFVDPLDDISGGKRDAGTAPTDSGALGEDDDDDARDAGTDAFDFDVRTSTFECTGAQESEPNNSSQEADLLADGLTCGVLTGGSADSDIFGAIYNSAGRYTVLVNSSVPVDVEVIDKDNPTGTSFKSDQTHLGQVTGPGALQVTVRAPPGTSMNVQYLIFVRLP